MFELVSAITQKIKNQNPLILNITNYVTMDFVANGLLSIGASPIMSFAPTEMNELVKLSNAIVINLGTLTDNFNQLVAGVCALANQHGKPIIFDPVGAGATQYRTETSCALLEKYQFAVIRANASEVMALAGHSGKTKGVDSQTDSIAATQFAETLSARFDSAVCMSGKVDVIIDQQQKTMFERGSFMMPKITGTGCLLSAVVAAFHAVHANRFEAVLAASFFYAVCGELAEKKSAGTASFKTNFIDILGQTPELHDYDKN